MPAKKKIPDLASAEIERRREEGRAQAIRGARHTVRVAAMACERFDHGDGGVWGDDDSNSLAERERCYELNPFDKRHRWPEANRLYSALWVTRWVSLADAFRALDALEDRTLEFVFGLEPEDVRHAAMHSLFVRLLGGGSAQRTAEALARTRAKLVPSAKEVRELGGWQPRARFELSHYFNWLLSSFAPRWDPPVVRAPTQSIAHETSQRVLELLRRESAAGRGITAKELARLVNRTEDRVTKIIRELRRAGHVIHNPGGGTGYVIAS